MGYREIIPPERLEEFEKLGESKVRVNLDAGLYGGRHKDHAILFIKLCESERKPKVRWHESWWGILLIGLLVAVIGGGLLFWLGWT